MPDFDPIRIPARLDPSGMKSGASQAIAALGGLENAALAGATALGAAGLAGSMAMSIRQATIFERRVADLSRVLGEDIARPMAESIGDLSTRLPVARRQLFEVAQEAGRMGITGRENILRFTETVAKMGVATDISSEQAAQGFSKILAQTGRTVDEMEALGSSANALSNQFATTFSDIVNNAQRAAPALSQLGISTEDIFAIGTALNEVSENSERAGTRLRRLGQEIRQVTGDDLEVMAGALDMTAEEFRRVRAEDPTQVILGLARAMREGGADADALTQLLGSRTLQVVDALASNFNRLTDALEISNEASKEATSLQEEFGKFAGIAEAQQKRLENQIRETAQEIGEELLPLFKEALEITGFWLDRLNQLFGLDDPFEQFVSPEKAQDLNNQLTSIVVGLREMGEQVSGVSDLREEIVGFAGQLETREGRLKFFQAVQQNLDRLEEGEITLAEFRRGLAISVTRIREHTQAQEETADQTDETTESVQRQTEAVEDAFDTWQDFQRALQRAKTEGLGDTAREMGVMESNVVDVSDEFDDMEQKVFTLEEALKQLKKSEKGQSAELMALAEQLRKTSDRMSEDVVDSFIDIVSGSENAVDAIADMVDGIIREMLRLVAQQTITKPLANFIASMIGNLFAPGAGAATKVGQSGALGANAQFGGGVKGGQVTLVGEQGPELLLTGTEGEVLPNRVVEGLKRRGGGSGGGGQNVQVNNNFNISAVDAKSVQRVLRENADAIMTITTEGFRRSSGARRTAFGG